MKRPAARNICRVMSMVPQAHTPSAPKETFTPRATISETLLIREGPSQGEKQPRGSAVQVPNNTSPNCASPDRVDLQCLNEVLGEDGGHPRGAIGCTSLPGDAPIQLVAMLRVS